MPEVDGFAVLEALREDGSERFLPIVVLTADMTEEAKARALEAGATDFLVKPVSQIEALLRIRNLLEARRLNVVLRNQRAALEEEEIRERCLYPLLNEGFRLLEEGVAVRASDIDVVWTSGYGFPRYRGGPMFHADTVGLYNVVRAMHRFENSGHGDPGFWRPAPTATKWTGKRGRDR